MSDPGLDDLEAFYGIDLEDEPSDAFSYDNTIRSDGHPGNPKRRHNNDFDEKNEHLYNGGALSPDSLSFDINSYITQSLSLPMHQLLQQVTELGEQKQHLDTEMQTLVYENYNKFITATDIIRSMNTSFESIEREMGLVHSNLQTISKQSSTMVVKLTEPRKKVTHFSSLSQLLQSLRYLFKLPTLMQYYYTSKQYGLALRSYDTVAPFLHRYKHLNSFSSILQQTSTNVRVIQTYLSATIKEKQLFHALEITKENNTFIGIVNQLLYQQYLSTTSSLSSSMHFDTSSASSSVSAQFLDQQQQQQQHHHHHHQQQQQPPNPSAETKQQILLLFTHFSKTDLIDGLDLLLLYILAGNQDAGELFKILAGKVQSLLTIYLSSSFCAIQHPQQPNYNFSLPSLLDFSSHNSNNSTNVHPISATTTTTATDSHHHALSHSHGSSILSPSKAAHHKAKHAQNAHHHELQDSELQPPFLLIDDNWIPVPRVQFDIDTKIAREVLNDVNTDVYSVEQLPRCSISPITKDTQSDSTPPSKLNPAQSPGQSQARPTSSALAQATTPPQPNDPNQNKGSAAINKNATDNMTETNTNPLDSELHKDLQVDAQLHTALSAQVFEKHAIYAELFASHHSHIFLSLFFFIHYAKQRLLLPLLHTMSLRNASRAQNDSFLSTLKVDELPAAQNTSEKTLLASQQHLYTNILSIMESINTLTSTVLSQYVRRIEFFTTQLFAVKPVLEQRRVAMTNAMQPNGVDVVPANATGPVSTFLQATMTQLQLTPCPFQLSIIALHSQLHISSYVANINNYIVGPLPEKISEQSIANVMQSAMDSKGTAGGKNAPRESVKESKPMGAIVEDDEDGKAGNPFENHEDDEDGGHKAEDIDDEDDRESQHANKAASHQFQPESIDFRQVFPNQLTNTANHNQSISNTFPTISQLTHKPLTPTSSSAKAALNTLSSISQGSILPAYPYSAVSLLTRNCISISPSNVVELYSLVNNFSIASISDITTATIGSIGLISSSLDDIIDTLDGLLVNIDIVSPPIMQSHDFPLSSHYSHGSTPNQKPPTLHRPHSTQSASSAPHTSYKDPSQILQTQITSLAPILVAFQRNSSTISINSSMFLYELGIRQYLNYLTLATNLLSSLALPTSFFNKPLHPSSTTISLDMDTKTQMKQNNDFFSLLLVDQKSSSKHSSRHGGLSGFTSSPQDNNDDDDDDGDDGLGLNTSLLVSNNLQLYNLDKVDESTLQKKRSETTALNSFLNSTSSLSASSSSSLALSTESKAPRKRENIPGSFFVVKSWLYALFNIMDDQFALTTHVVQTPDHHSKKYNQFKSPKNATSSSTSQDEELTASIETIKQYCSPVYVSQQFAQLFMSFYSTLIPFIDLHTIKYKQSFLSQQQQSQLTSLSSNLNAGLNGGQMYGNLSNLTQLLPHVTNAVAATQRKNATITTYGGGLKQPSKYHYLASQQQTQGISVGNSRLSKLASLTSMLGGLPFTTGTGNAAGALTCIAPGYFAMSTLPMTLTQHTQNYYSNPYSNSSGSHMGSTYNSSSAGSISHGTTNWDAQSLRYGSQVGSIMPSSLAKSAQLQQNQLNVDYAHNEKQLECKAIFIVLLLRTLYSVLYSDPILCAPEKHTHIHIKDYRVQQEHTQLEQLLNLLANSYGFLGLSLPNNKDVVDSYQLLLHFTTPLSVLSTIYKSNDQGKAVTDTNAVSGDKIAAATGPATAVAKPIDGKLGQQPGKKSSVTSTASSSSAIASATIAGTGPTATSTSTYLSEYLGYASTTRLLPYVSANSPLALAFKLYSTRSIVSLNENITQPHLSVLLTQAFNTFYSQYFSSDTSGAALISDAFLLNSEVLTHLTRPYPTQPQTTAQQQQQQQQQVALSPPSISSTLSVSSGASGSNLSTQQQKQQVQDKYRQHIILIANNLGPVTLRAAELCSYYISTLNGNLIEVVQHISPILDFSSKSSSSSSSSASASSSFNSFNRPSISLLELKICLTAMMKNFSALSTHLHNNINLHISRITTNLIRSHLTFGQEALNQHVLTFNNSLYTPVPLENAIISAPSLLIHNPTFVPWKTTPSTMSQFAQYVISYLDHLHWFIHVVVLNLEPPKQRANTISTVAMKYNYSTSPECNCHHFDSHSASERSSASAEYDDYRNALSNDAQKGNRNLFSQFDKLIGTNTHNPSAMSSSRLLPVQTVDCVNIFSNAMVSVITSMIMKAQSVPSMTSNAGSLSRLDKYDIQRYQVDFYAFQLAILNLCHKQDKAMMTIKQLCQNGLQYIFSRFSPSLHNSIILQQNAIKKQLKLLIEQQQTGPTGVTNINTALIRYYHSLPSHVFNPCEEDLCMFTDVKATLQNKAQPQQQQQSGAQPSSSFIVVDEDGSEATLQSSSSSTAPKATGLTFQQQFKMKVLLQQETLDRILSTAFYPVFNLHTIPYLNDD